MSYVEAEKPTCKFHESVRRGLRSAMYHLGLCRSEENREEFQQTLVRIGMPISEAGVYYDLVRAHKPTFPSSMKLFRSNTEFVQEFGVALIDSAPFPRCWLLYRLCELIAPDEFRYVLSGTRHMGGNTSRKGPLWKPNPLAVDRRIITIVKSPRYPDSDNLIPPYKLL